MRQGVDDEGYLDIKGVKVRFLGHVENLHAGVPVADLCSDDFDVLLNLSGAKNRLPKGMAEALSLLPRSTCMRTCCRRESPQFSNWKC